MRVFLLIFLGIYGSANFYVFWKLRSAIRGYGWGVQAGLGLFILLMVFGPIGVRMLEQAGWIWAAWATGLIVFVWMALLLWFISLGLLADIWNLAVWVLRQVWPEAGRLSLPLRPALTAIGVLLLLASGWGLIEAQRIRLERITLRSPHLPPGSPPLRVVQISDLHLGLIERESRLRKVLRLIDQVKPDLVLSTGDMVDGTADHMESLADTLAGLKPPLGKFAVTGNHEVYAGLRHSIATLERAGFRVLRGESVAVGDALRLAGVDDPAVFGRGDREASRSRAKQQEAQALADDNPGTEAAPTRSTLLLKHQPLIDEASLGRFALQLSGHTHKGQIIPFNLLVRLRYPHLAGFLSLERGSALYVSRGTGTWGPPMRLGSPPELTLITIEPGS